MPHIAIYTLSLHDALPIYAELVEAGQGPLPGIKGSLQQPGRGVVLREDAVIIFGYRERKTPDLDFHAGIEDRKSTRLNSSHLVISYAVLCLKTQNYHTSEL